MLKTMSGFNSKNFLNAELSASIKVTW